MYSIKSAYDQEYLEKRCESVLVPEIKDDLMSEIKEIEKDKRLSSFTKNLEIDKLLLRTLMFTSAVHNYDEINYNKLTQLELVLKNFYNAALIQQKAEIDYLRKKLEIKSLKD